MQIFSNGDNLHEMSNPIFWKKEKISICPLLNLPIEWLSKMNMHAMEVLIGTFSKKAALKGKRQEELHILYFRVADIF